MGAGYVGIVSIDLHLPDSGSLKEKRKDVLSLKADLQRRFAAAVAEVDYHDLWQRSLLTASLVDRRARDLESRLDDVERYVLARHETASVRHHLILSPEEIA
jgi:hypothetical protein